MPASVDRIATVKLQGPWLAASAHVLRWVTEKSAVRTPPPPFRPLSCDDQGCSFFYCYGIRLPILLATILHFLQCGAIVVNELFDLWRMRRKDLVAVFKELHAPPLQTMNGEFRASLLDQGRWANNFITILAFNAPGVWISKSFSPLSDEEGHGYNSFRVGSNIKRIYRMRTHVGPSRLDDRPSFHLNYAPLNRGNVPALTRLAGEVRQFRESVYLGMGTADFGISRLRRPQPFLLEGPVSAYEQLPAAA